MVIDTQREILGFYADQGFSIEEPDDDILVLNHQGELVGRFLQTGPTKEMIRDECERHLHSQQLSQNNSYR